MRVVEQYHADDLDFRFTCDDIPHPEELFRHVHDQCEILYFLKGNARYIVESHEYILKPNTLVLTRPTEFHRMELQRLDIPYYRYVIHFDPHLLDAIDPAGRFMRPFFDRPLGQLNAYDASEFGTIKPLSLFEAMSRHSLTSEERRTDLLTYMAPLLSQLEQVYSEKITHPLADRSDLSAQIVDYINEHLLEDLSLPGLCQRFYISQSHLERLFKQATGVSVWQYIVHKRLAIARTMIQSGQSATTVATACGFRDYSTFYRTYIRTYGISPQKDRLGK